MILMFIVLHTIDKLTSHLEVRKNKILHPQSALHIKFLLIWF